MQREKIGRQSARRTGRLPNLFVISDTDIIADNRRGRNGCGQLTNAADAGYNELSQKTKETGDAHERSRRF